jgi:predicted nucleic acid-binding protein
MSVARRLWDTGPLVSLLDARDTHHAACLQAAEAMWPQPLTTEAVVTEAAYLLRRVPNGPVRLMEFLVTLKAEIVPITSHLRQRVATLMKQYAEQPMDYADATLVAVAEERRLSRIFTLDRRHFLIYRLHDRESFEIVP